MHMIQIRRLSIADEKQQEDTIICSYRQMQNNFVFLIVIIFALSKYLCFGNRKATWHSHEHMLLQKQIPSSLETHMYFLYLAVCPNN